MDFCKCGSIQIKGKCSNKHCPIISPKNKTWVIDGKAMDFNKPASYEEAAELVRRHNMKE
jgi:hypothetical protein